MAINEFTFKAGSTSKRVQILLETASTANSGKTGLAYNTASLTSYYIRDGDASATNVALADPTSIGHAWVSSGFIKISDANMPGLYDYHIPDAVLAAGAKLAWIWIGGSAAFTTQGPQIKINLVSYDPDDSVRLGLTSLPNAAAGGAGGLLTCTSANVLPTGAIAAASFAAGAIDAAAIATDAIGSAEIAATAATEIGTANVASSLVPGLSRRT